MSLSAYAASISLSIGTEQGRTAALQAAEAAGFTLNVYASEGFDAQEDCGFQYAAEAAEADISLVYLTRQD